MLNLVNSWSFSSIQRINVQRFLVSKHYCLAYISIVVLVLFDSFIIPTVNALERRDPYTILGVSRNTPMKEIKGAYRRLSKKYHPDKSTEENAEAKFIEVSNAYQILSDDKKRAIFDKYGYAGLDRESNGSNFQDSREQFRQWAGSSFFFGGSSGSRGFQRKAPATVIPLYVSLEELYSGTEIEYQISKQIMCYKCEGCGAKSKDDIKDCSECNGQGIVLQIRRLGPGMIQQVQSECSKCRGKGKIAKNVCEICKGKKAIHGNEDVVVEVPKGAPTGFQVTVENSGDFIPDFAPGDLKFIINTQPHNSFFKDGNNLYKRIILTLDEALRGFTKEFKHINGEMVRITRNKCTQPGYTMTIEEKGMPIFNSDYNYGNLYVTFDVILPENHCEITAAESSTESKIDKDEL